MSCKQTRSLQACTKYSEDPQTKKRILNYTHKTSKKNNNKELRRNTAGDLCPSPTNLANAFNNFFMPIAEKI